MSNKTYKKHYTIEFKNDNNETEIKHVFVDENGINEIIEEMNKRKIFYTIIDNEHKRCNFEHERETSRELGEIDSRFL
jgi:phage terminase large subunit-like protein